MSKQVYCAGCGKLIGSIEAEWAPWSEDDYRITDVETQNNDNRIRLDDGPTVVGDLAIRCRDCPAPSDEDTDTTTRKP